MNEVANQTEGLLTELVTAIRKAVAAGNPDAASTLARTYETIVNAAR